jgi:hypothetical protein
VSTLPTSFSRARYRGWLQERVSVTNDCLTMFVDDTRHEALVKGSRSMVSANAPCWCAISTRSSAFYRGCSPAVVARRTSCRARTARRASVFRSVGQILSPRRLGARRRIGNFAWRSHEHRLKRTRGGHGTEKRKCHHLAHTRCARISREPKALKGCRCRQRTECHGAPQGSTAAGSFCRIATPRCNRS